MTETKRRGRPAFVLPYNEARQIVKSMNFDSKSEYVEWVITEKPEGFSKDPYQTYRLRGDWVSYAHFLGKTNDIPCQDIVQQIEAETFNYEGNPFSKIKNLLHKILHNFEFAHN
jgi:hypothetical protein